MDNLIEKNASNSEKRSFDNFYTQPIFSILGLDIFLDDIIILCILFSMYKDGIKDKTLFIVLVLLLFS